MADVSSTIASPSGSGWVINPAYDPPGELGGGAGGGASAVRDDALATLGVSDGADTDLRTDSTGALWVRDTGGSSGAAAVRDDALSALGTGEGVSTDLRVDSTGALWVRLVSAGALALRDDALATLGVADGALTELRTDSTGALWVHVASGSAGGAQAIRDDVLSTLATADGVATDLRVNSQGALHVTLATELAGEDVAADMIAAGVKMGYSAISGAATTTLATASCVFVGVRVVTPATAGGTVTAYDNSAASGTKLLDAESSDIRGATHTVMEGAALDTATGLTIVTTGTGGLVIVMWKAKA